MPVWNTVTVQIDGQTLVQSPVSFGGTEIQHEVGSGWVKFHATDYAAMAAVNIGSYVKTTISTSVGLTTFVVNEFIVDEIPQTTGDGHFVTIRGQDRLIELDYRPVKWPISHEVTGTIRSDNLTSTTCRVDFDSPSDDAQPDGYYDGWSIRTSGGSIGTIGDAAGGDWEGFLTTLNNIVLDTEWKPAAPSAGETCIIYGVLPSLTDVSDIIAYAPNWSLEVGSATATTSGTYDGEVVEESVLDLLRQTAEQSGEYFERVESERRIRWSDTISLAGHPSYLGDVILTSSPDYTRIDNDWQYGIIKRLTKTEFTQQKVTRVRPYGAGLGSSRLTLSSLASGFTPATGYSIVADEGGAFLVHDASESGGDYVLKTKSFPWIGPTNDSTPAAQAAAATLYQSAYQWLREQVASSDTVEIECICHVPLRPNQSIRVVYDAFGMNIDQSVVILSVDRSFDANQGYLIQTIKGVYLQVSLSGAKISSYGGSFRGGQQLVADYLKQIKTVLAHANSPGGGTTNFISLNGGKSLRLGTSAESLATLYDVSANIQELEMDLQAANTVLAAPDSAIGSASFRTLIENDLPVLSPSFLTLSTSPKLSNERTLTAGTGISFTDNGANGTLVVNRDALAASDLPTHDIISKHSYSGGSTLNVVGLSAPSTLAMLTPSSNVLSGSSAILKSDSGKLILKQLGVGLTPATNHLLTIDGTWTDIAQARGLGVEVQHDVLDGYSTGYGYTVTSKMSVTGTAGSSISNLTQALFSGGGGTLGDLTGTFSRNGITGASPTGAITNSIGFKVGEPTNQSTGTASVSVTNAKGLEVRNQGVIGSGVSVENVIGLEVYAQTGGTSNNIAMRTNGGNIIHNNGRDAATSFWIYGTGSTPVFVVKDAGTTIGGLWNAAEKLEVNGNIRLTGGGNDATINTGAGPLILDPATDVQIDGDGETPGVGASIGSDHFVSEATGWRMTYAGELDARYIYTDELRAQFFTAAVTQAFNGAIILTKSISEELAQKITTAGDYSTYSTQVTLKVQDMAGWSGYALFSDGDYVRMRHMDTSGGGLSFGDVWGTVHGYTDNGDGTQSWNWRQTYPVGAGGVGLTIPVGSTVLNYGEPNDGIWKATTLDRGNSPYSQYSTWSSIVEGKPVEEVKARVGNLAGIAGVGGAYGIWAGSDPAGPRLIAGDSGIEVHGGKISAYEGGEDGTLRLFAVRVNVDYSSGTSNLDPNSDSEVSTRYTNSGSENAYQQVNDYSSINYSDYIYNNSSASGYVWLGLESTSGSFDAAEAASLSVGVRGSGFGFVNDKATLWAQVFKSDKETPLTTPLLVADETSNAVTEIDFGWVDESASKADWDGAVLLLTWKYRIVSSTETIRLDPTVPSLAIGNPLPGEGSGEGFWVGLKNGAYQLRIGMAGGQRFQWDGNEVGLYNAANSKTIAANASGNVKIEGVLNIGTAGELRQGSGALGIDYTGVRMWNESGIGRIAGYNDNTLQAGFDTSGKLTAGGGSAIMDEDGLIIKVNSAEQLARSISFLDENDNNYEVARLTASAQSGTNYLYLKTREQASHGAFTAIEAHSPSGKSSTVQLYSTYDLGGGGSESAYISVSASNALAQIEMSADLLTFNGYFDLSPITYTPSSPASGETKVYLRGGNFILQHNDGGTIRYKYLDLTGTGTTWTHATTAPS